MWKPSKIEGWRLDVQWLTMLRYYNGLQHVGLLGDIGNLQHILMPPVCTLSVLSGAKWVTTMNPWIPPTSHIYLVTWSASEIPYNIRSGSSVSHRFPTCFCRTPVYLEHPVGWAPPRKVLEFLVFLFFHRQEGVVLEHLWPEMVLDLWTSAEGSHGLVMRFSTQRYFNQHTSTNHSSDSYQVKSFAGRREQHYLSSSGMLIFTIQYHTHTHVHPSRGAKHFCPKVYQ